MSRFRREKLRLMRALQRDSWQEHLRDELAGADKAALSGLISPLISFLNRPDLRWQSAFALGQATARLAEKDMESARVVMRRLMWGMNEESGNLGWGIPEAMGCILGQCPALAAEYARIFATYVRDTKREDNFVEYPPLRSGAYWGVGHLAAREPEKMLSTLGSLVQALRTEEPPNKCMAAWALGRLAGAASREAFAGEKRQWWEQAAEAMEALKTISSLEVTVMEHGEVRELSAATIAAASQTTITDRLRGLSS